MVEIRGLCKAFGVIQALKDVNLRINQASVRVLLGENGAGKSTLMKVLYGMYAPDQGELFFDGRNTVLRNSHQAIDLGIGMVHQHFMLVEEFSGYENVVLGFEPKKSGQLDRGRMISEVNKLKHESGIDIDLSRRTGAMTVGERQKVEILKLLHRKSDILILDEPTAVLTPNETHDLFAMIRILKDQGKGVVLITHKLHEALEIADEITVLRDGVVVSDGIDPEGKSREDLAKMMVGRDVALYSRKPSPKVGEPLFVCEDITTESSGDCALKSIHFSVHEGEILGIAGVDGNGQRELVEAIAGLRETAVRRVFVQNQPVPAGTPDILKSGIAFVFEDRSFNGLIENMSVNENAILGYHRESSLKRGFLLSQKKTRERAKRLIKEYQVRTPSDQTSVGDLSGGNQQKILIARALGAGPSIAVISQPTRGVDIGAMEYIHESIQLFRDLGNAILLISADLDEVKSLSDRILIIHEGEIVVEGKPTELSDTEIGLYMTGSHPD